MEVAERIRSHGARLTVAERRVAEAILAAPQAVGFGTVADLARAADVGAASVVRLATKLGFDGYTDLQQCIQRDLTDQLRPAAERIREIEGGERSAHLAAEIANVQATLDGADPASVDALVGRLADLDRPVATLSGVASAGVALQFTSQLSQLRSDVTTIAGSDVEVRRDIALLDPRASALVIDLRRYDRWVLDAHAALVERGVWTASFSDSVLSPIAAHADVTFVVSAAAVGPFDSHVGSLALLDLVVTEVADALRSTAGDRLGRVEAAWSRHSSLTDGV